MAWDNILSILDFSTEDITRFLELTADLKKHPREGSLRGMHASLLFFEPSTRTFTSFRNAVTRLGGSIAMEFRTPGGTSVEKRESMASTLAMAKEYGTDITVMRHPRDGSAAYASEVTDIPIINGGDGHHEHPTQNLIDLFTIWERFGRLDHLTFLFFNDLKYSRTTRLAYPLSLFPGNRFFFLSHKELAVPRDITHALDKRGCEWEEWFDPRKFPELLREAHVAYGSRTQEERFPKTAEGRELLAQVRGSLVLTSRILATAPKDLIILHPLPMDNQYPCIAPDTLKSEHAYWNRQAGNGIPARQAMLLLVMKKAGKEEVTY